MTHPRFPHHAIKLMSVVVALLGFAGCDFPKEHRADSSIRAQTQVVIVFVHGLGGSSDTWTAHTWLGEDVYWPTLVQRDIPEARILVAEYASATIGKSNSIDELAAELGDFLDARQAISAHQRIMFVAHSLGGLVVQAFLAQHGAQLSGKQILFLALGSPWKGATPGTTYLARSGIASPLLKAIEARRSTFRDFLPPAFQTRCASELFSVGLLGFGPLVVDKDSATTPCTMPGSTRQFAADHFSLAKPQSSASANHSWLVAEYRRWTDPSKQYEEPAAALDPVWPIDMSLGDDSGGEAAACGLLQTAVASRTGELSSVVLHPVNHPRGANPHLMLFELTDPPLPARRKMVADFGDVAVGGDNKIVAYFAGSQRIIEAGKTYGVLLKQENDGETNWYRGRRFFSVAWPSYSMSCGKPEENWRAWHDRKDLQKANGTLIPDTEPKERAYGFAILVR